jgi:hypothetical protein
MCSIRGHGILSLVVGGQSSASNRQVRQSLALLYSSTEPQLQPVHVPRRRYDLRAGAGAGESGQAVWTTGVPLLHSIRSPAEIAPPQAAHLLLYFAVIVMAIIRFGRWFNRPPHDTNNTRLAYECQGVS